MPHPTKLAKIYRRIEGAIERASMGPGKGAGAGRRSAQRRAGLRRELALWLASWRTHEDFPGLAALRVNWKAIDRDEDFTHRRLAGAIAILAKRPTMTHRALCKLVGTNLTDLRYALNLLKEYEIQFAEIETEIGIRSTVVAYFQTMRLRIEPRALEDILLAAAESYLVSPGRGARYSEVFGLCFGSSRRVDNGKLGETIEIGISRVATQLRARATSSSVNPNERSFEAQFQVARQFFPHLSVVGNYHTHPYNNLATLKANKGWVYSPSDGDTLPWFVDQMAQHHSVPYFSLIVAVASGSRQAAVRDTTRVITRNNVAQFAIGDLYFRIGAYRICLDGTYDDKITLVL
ncbi:MAG TPA: hypothetical protein PLF40_10855 [Kofleriaceae bacterium]|nr:hypothetical protein [Kofleriaceae bacterium]